MRHDTMETARRHAYATIHMYDLILNATKGGQSCGAVILSASSTRTLSAKETLNQRFDYWVDTDDSQGISKMIRSRRFSNGESLPHGYWFADRCNDPV